MSIKVKMILGFSLLLLIFALSSIFVFFQFNKLQTEVNILAGNSVPSLEVISQMDNDVLNVSRYVYAFAAATDDNSRNEQKSNLDSKLKSFAQHSAIYEPLISSQEEKMVYGRFTEKWNLYQQQLSQLQNYYSAQDYESANRLIPAMRALFNEANVLMQQLVEINTAAAKESAATSNEAVNFTKTVLLGSVVISIILGIIIAILITLSIVRPIHELEDKLKVLIERGGDLTHRIEVDTKDEVAELAIIVNEFLKSIHAIVAQTMQISEQLASASEELNASAEQSAQALNQVAHSITEVAEGASQQAQAASEASAVVEQMSAGSEQAASNAHQVSGAADKASLAAREGGNAIIKTVQQMSSIENTSKETAEAIEILQARSEEIGQIVETISTIAKQTNLLSLNAAIEAARAGEAGRGFAVVAEEIRKLAESSQKSAKKISDLIHVIQEDTVKAVERMNSGVKEVKVGAQVVSTAGEAFNNIRQLVEEVSSQVQDISATIQQLASGSQHIVTSVQTINTVAKEAAAHTQTVSAATEEQSASMEEIASASQNLAQLAHTLENVVKRFTV